jgi:hypothetical protein
MLVGDRSLNEAAQYLNLSPDELRAKLDDPANNRHLKDKACVIERIQSD